MAITTTELQATIGLDDAQFQAGKNRTKQGLAEITEEAKKTTSAFDQLASKGAEVSAMGATLTVGISAPIIGLGVAAVETAARFDSLHRGMVAITGSAQEANRQFVSLKEVAKLPGLGFEEAIRGAMNLQAAGLSADQAQKTLMAFGNALAITGRGKNDLMDVQRVLMQIESTGKVTAREIRELAIRIPQIRQVMIQEFGTADTEIIQKSSLTSQEFIERITKRLAELPKVTGGIANDFENLSDHVNQALNTIGQSLIPVASALSNTIGPAVEKVANAFAGLPEGTKQSILVFAGLAAALGPVLFVMGQLAVATARIHDGWTALRTMGPVIRAIFLGKADAVTKDTLATTANTDAATVNTKVVTDDAAAVGTNAKVTTDAELARSKWNTSVVVSTEYLGTNTKVVADNTLAEAANAKAAGDAALMRNAGLPVGLSPAVAAARAAPAAGGLSRALPIGFGGLLTAALLINQAKNFLPDTTGAGGQHGETGLLADISAGALVGAGIGTFAGPVGTGAGALVGGALGGLFNARGEKARTDEQNKKMEEETAANIQAEHARKQAEKASKGSLPVDAAAEAAKKLEEAQKLADAQYDAQLTGIKASLEGKDSDKAKSREAAATIPLLKERLTYVQKQAADEKAAHGLTVEYYRWQKEFFNTQQSIIGLRSAAQDETKKAQEKRKEQQAAVEDARYSAFNQYVQTRVTDAEPDQKARVEREEMAPVLTQRQQQLVQRARTLLPQTAGNLDNQKEYYALVKQYWALEEQMGQMDARAVAEEKAQAKKAHEEMKKTAAAFREYQQEVVSVQILSLPEEDRAMAELTQAVPVLKQEQAELMQEAATMKPGTEEYFRAAKAFWALEKQIVQNTNAQQKEVRKRQEEAKTAIEGAAHERREIMDLEGKIMESKLKNNPFLTERQREQAIIPNLIRQYRQLLRAVPGESRTEGLRRELDASQLAGEIYKDAGLRKENVGRTIGGGSIFLGDPRQVRSVMQQLRKADSEAARENQRILSTGSMTKDGISIYNLILHGRTPEERREEALHFLENAERQVHP